jgi:hypothetical protein
MNKKLFLTIAAVFTASLVYSQMKINQEGNVSIGSIEPSSYQLKIKSGTGYIEVGSPTSGYACFRTDKSRFYFNKGLVLSSGALVTNTTSNFTFQTNGFGYPKMIILYSAGYVGINKGPNNPQYNLDVSGNIRATGSIIDSDERLKEQVVDTKEGEINQLYELKAKKYKLKPKEYASPDKDSDKDHFGFIAQELREIYPELVYEDSSGYLSINYIEVRPYLKKA